MTSSPPPKKTSLLTFSSGGWVLLVSLLFTLVAAFLVLLPVWQTGFRSAVGDGANPDTYGFYLNNLTIPRDQLLAVGISKDGIRAIPSALAETATPEQVDLITKNEHIRFLVPEDRIIGLTIGAESRAYPVRVLAVHELCNDFLGDGPSRTPVAISYSPLCDSIVVFDRRSNLTKNPDSAPEFGVSGLLYNSNLIMYDRQSNPRDESLWSQLALRAISGPQVNTPLNLLPYELTTWGQWRKKHPTTLALLGLRTLKKQYGREPYNLYYADDQLKFPVAPLWPGPQLKKLHIAVTHYSTTTSTTAPTLLWRAIPAENLHAATTTPSHPITLHTFLFAWYAFHKDTTDWSSLPPKN